MKMSISVTSYSWARGRRLPAELVATARAAETAGVDTVWLADHLLQMDPHAQPDEPMLEAYTALGFLAAVTERVRLGTMVTWATLRPPALLVKAVTTLDVLSGGRAWFGVGAGYQAEEAGMMGLPFPTTAERFDRLEELLQIAEHLWSGDPAPFHGRYHRLDRPINSPPPRRRPRVLVGGTGGPWTEGDLAVVAGAIDLMSADAR